MTKTYFKYFLALLLFGLNGIVASHITMNSYEIVFTRTLIDAIFIIGGAILRETLDLYIKKHLEQNSRCKKRKNKLLSVSIIKSKILSISISIITLFLESCNYSISFTQQITKQFHNFYLYRINSVKNCVKLRIISICFTNLK